MHERNEHRAEVTSPANAQDIEALCAHHGNNPARLIEILHDVQHALGYIPESALPVIAYALNRSRAEIYGTMSFYHDFRSTPCAGADISVCLGEACRAMGAAELMVEVEAAYSKDSIREVYCLGNCALGPSALVNGQLIGRANKARIHAQIGASDS